MDLPEDDEEEVPLQALSSDGPIATGLSDPSPTAPIANPVEYDPMADPSLLGGPTKEPADTQYSVVVDTPLDCLLDQIPVDIEELLTTTAVGASKLDMLSNSSSSEED